jgi:hypothetical protein
VIDVSMKAEHFDFAKKQAESYGVSVEEMERWKK